MPKSNEEALPEFKSLVNMTIPSLSEWLQTSDSKNTGWTADGTGEAVGHESGRKIVKILGKLEKDEEGGELSEEDWGHVRKVVGYVKRHLAQESAGDDAKSDEDLRKTKSYASLKNWGHDFIQARDEKKGGGNQKSSTPSKAKAGEKRKAAPKEKEEEDDDKEEEEEEEEEDAEGDADDDEEEEDAAGEEVDESNDEEGEEIAEDAAQEEEEEAAEKAKEEPAKKKARVADEEEEKDGEEDGEGVASSTRSHD